MGEPALSQSSANVASGPSGPEPVQEAQGFSAGTLISGGEGLDPQ